MYHHRHQHVVIVYAQQEREVVKLRVYWFSLETATWFSYKVVRFVFTNYKHNKQQVCKFVLK